MLQTCLHSHIILLFGVIPPQDVHSHDCILSLELDKAIHANAPSVRGLFHRLPVLCKGHGSRMESSLDTGIQLGIAAKRRPKEIPVAYREGKIWGLVGAARDLDSLLASLG
jgi:hypothetical protein